MQFWFERVPLKRKVFPQGLVTEMPAKNMKIQSIYLNEEDITSNKNI